MAAVGLGLVGLAQWTIMRDLRVGGGWAPGPAAGTARALGSAALLGTAIAILASFAAAYDAAEAREDAAGPMPRLLAVPISLAVMGTGVVLGTVGPTHLLARFVVAQIGVISAGLVAASLGYCLARSVTSRALAISGGLSALACWSLLVVAAGPAAPWLSQHPLVTQAVLVMDPLVTVSRLLGIDYLRGEHVYRLTPLALHRFVYPPPAIGLATQGIVAVGLIGLSYVRCTSMRREEE